MNYYINSMITALRQRMSNYKPESDTYKELHRVIEELEMGLKLEQKLVRQY